MKEFDPLAYLEQKRQIERDAMDELARIEAATEASNAVPDSEPWMQLRQRRREARQAKRIATMLHKYAGYIAELEDEARCVLYPEEPTIKLHNERVA